MKVESALNDNKNFGVEYLFYSTSFALNQIFVHRYESATDVGLSLQGQWEAATSVGVPRRELLYQPLQTKWATPSHTPHTLTPHTLTPPHDQGLAEAEGEGDSGFQEAGGCVGLACPPLVSPERAREALMLGAGKQLVPMVGLQQMPVSDELSATYMDKARQASEYRNVHVKHLHKPFIPFFLKKEEQNNTKSFVQLRKTVNP